MQLLLQDGATSCNLLCSCFLTDISDVLNMKSSGFGYKRIVHALLRVIRKRKTQLLIAFTYVNYAVSHNLFYSLSEHIYPGNPIIPCLKRPS